MRSIPIITTDLKPSAHLLGPVMVKTSIYPHLILFYKTRGRSLRHITAIIEIDVEESVGEGGAVK